MPVIVGACTYTGGSEGACGARAAAGVSSAAPSRTQSSSSRTASGGSAAPPIGMRGSSAPVTSFVRGLFSGAPFATELPCFAPPLTMPA